MPFPYYGEVTNREEVSDKTKEVNERMYKTGGTDIVRTSTDVGQPEETFNKNQRQVALSDFLSLTKHKIRQSRKRKQLRKVEECSWKILILCDHYHSFHACYSKLYEKVFAQVAMQYCPDYPNCRECEVEAFDDAVETGILYPCWCEHMVDDEVNAIIETSKEDLRRTYSVGFPALVWRKGEQILASCKCRLTGTNDDWNDEREALTEMAKYEPCKFRCKRLQDNRECWYQEDQNAKAQRIQRKLTRYFPRTKRKVAF
jgi:hypothetical protein